MCAHVFCVETRNGGNTSGTCFSDVDQRGGLRRDTSDIYLVCTIRCALYVNCSHRIIFTEYKHQKPQLCLNQSERTLVPPVHHTYFIPIAYSQPFPDVVTYGDSQKVTIRSHHSLKVVTLEFIFPENVIRRCMD